MWHFSFTPVHRASGVLMLFCASVLLSACTDRSYVNPSQPANPVDLNSPILADIGPAYEACLERCDEQSDLGSLTREGCLKGCAESRRRAELRDKMFASRQMCIDALYVVELNRDLIIEDHQEWCTKQWSHLYKRRGCEDAVAVFYAHITAPEVCGSDALHTPSRLEDVSVMPLGPVPGTTPVSPPSVATQPSPAAQPAPASVTASASDSGYLQDSPKYQSPSIKKTTKKKSATQPVKGKKPAQTTPEAPQKDMPAPNVREKDAAAVTPAITVPTQPTPITAPSPVPMQPASLPVPAQPTPADVSNTAPDPQRVPAVAPGPSDAPERSMPASSTGVPIPSMLEKPYSTPPVLSPATPPPVPPLPPIDQQPPPADAGTTMP